MILSKYDLIHKKRFRCPPESFLGGYIIIKLVTFYMLQVERISDEERNCFSY
jgi:hypothetical protein